MQTDFSNLTKSQILPLLQRDITRSIKMQFIYMTLLRLISLFQSERSSFTLPL